MTASTTVIHGTADRVIALSGGRATAAAIAGARLIAIDGMGHDLPPAVWPRIVDAIAAYARPAGRGRSASNRRPMRVSTGI